MDSGRTKAIAGTCLLQLVHTFVGSQHGPHIGARFLEIGVIFTVVGHVDAFGSFFGGESLSSELVRLFPEVTEIDLESVDAFSEGGYTVTVRVAPRAARRLIRSAESVKTPAGLSSGDTQPML